jgi:putative flippase GtrA
MSKWQNETAYLGRYAGSGVLNTLAGFSVIFLLMAIGVAPLLANISGYIFGLILGFFLSKKLVFRSEGHMTSEGLRYLAAFLTCFVANLFTLQFALSFLRWNAVPAQLLAAIVYTVIMYLLTRLLVFRSEIVSSHHNRQDSH